MTKRYQSPDIEIERFDFTDILTLSEADMDDAGIGASDQKEDPWD